MGSTATEDVVPENKTPSPTSVTKLYRHDCEYNCCASRWSEFPSTDDDHVALDKKIAKISIVHRHVFEEKRWVTKSFTINSLLMRQILVKALSKYQDLDMDLEEWTFQPPYAPLVHRWEQLATLRAEMKDGPEKNAADELINFLTPITASAVDHLAKTRETKKVTFEYIWQILPPGELAVTKLYGVDTVCRVVKYEKTEIQRIPVWIIHLEYVDWNGQNCGYAATKTVISAFSGYRRVTGLPVYPLSFEEDVTEIREKMIKRGRQFEKYRGYHFLTCNGKRVLIETSEERTVTGRVIVDAFAYYSSHSIPKPSLRSLVDEEEPIRTPKPQKDWDTTDIPNSDSDSEVMVEGNELQVVVTKDTNISRNENFTAMTDEHCLLATPWVKGMDLKTKEWSQFLVDELEEIVWNEKAFDNLVLPEGEKELVWDFVESKNMSNYAYDDFIPEKGRGIIVLMFGPPGVGKTYTAEAAAEKSRVPLYCVSAGVLGTLPSDVEKTLDDTLELCRLWNAMLLLDEADVFLGARTNEGLARNELVSIFLTKLEYYQGMLFLTTNRIASIDRAFQSRVDLFLPYHDLLPPARRQVWINFFNHIGTDKFDVNDADLDELEILKLNGREIKNLIKSSQLLGYKSGGKVDAAKLKMLAQKRLAALEKMED
ncbi:P-loop containing nucleoside triphosphate hydrolase protein [Mollisia scopiformis]|uniref:p-loop containing nucleoside triphosphate hydrolase protein n=1 Tax=Mollisia scopiformis TaxID=149040 RepID=A0A194XM85_MOLSC|nr:P-loop containing nucleoside triphosphate hydrolase protein [Mollisia scopiformis]KUJ21199.1 P-loop containing nucleoside triphosphate hydrolase protein [Mollisia scopiformis]